MRESSNSSRQTTIGLILLVGADLIQIPAFPSFFPILCNIGFCLTFTSSPPFGDTLQTASHSCQSHETEQSSQHPTSSRPSSLSRPLTNVQVWCLPVSSVPLATARPQKRPNSLAGMAQLRSDMAATAEPQTASPFFDKLPFEIREKIFDELWAFHDTRWHVHSAGEHVVPVFPCITDAHEEDTRYAHFQGSRGVEALTWESRLRSPWNTHWRCAEAAAVRATNPRTGRTASPRDYVRRRPSFASPSSPLLVCKRWYVGCQYLLHFVPATPLSTPRN